MFSVAQRCCFVVVLNLIFRAGHFAAASSEDDFGAELISRLKNEANSDKSVDEEYEDLQAELLAYKSVLASLATEDLQSRKSLKTTPCWQAGGICIHHQLCTGFRSLTEIPACKNSLNVCCFKWNIYQVRDFREKGIGNAAYPWSHHPEFGGKGVLEVEPIKPKKKKLKGKKQKKLNESIATRAKKKNSDIIILKVNK